MFEEFDPQDPIWENDRPLSKGQKVIIILTLAGIALVFVYLSHRAQKVMNETPQLNPPAASSVPGK